MSNYDCVYLVWSYNEEIPKTREVIEVCSTRDTAVDLIEYDYGDAGRLKYYEYSEEWVYDNWLHLWIELWEVR